MKLTTSALLLAAVAACGFVPATASAQTAARQTATVTANAPIYIGAAVSPTPLRVAAPGTVLKVLQQEGDWVNVEFNDPQWGPRVGWVQRALVKFSTEGLQPMDLSVREATPGVAPSTTRRSPQTEGSTNQTTTSRQRGWLDVNLEMTTPAEKTFTSTGSVTISQELSTWTFKYDIPTRKGVDVAAGGFITKFVGVGVAVSADRSSGYPILTDTEPHPFYFNASATGTLTGTATLDRSETGVHLQAVFRPDVTGPMQLRIYGGPSYFSVKQQMIDDFNYRQVYGILNPSNTVTIESYTWKRISTTAWGFNVGADVAYFFSKNIGLGGFIRYAGASATVPNTAQDLTKTGTTQTVKVGGTSFGFGLRTRF